MRVQLNLIKLVIVIGIIGADMLSKTTYKQQVKLRITSFSGEHS